MGNWGCSRILLRSSKGRGMSIALKSSVFAVAGNAAGEEDWRCNGRSVTKYWTTVARRPVVKGGYGPGWEVSGSRGCGTERRKEMKGRMVSVVRFALRRKERYF